MTDRYIDARNELMRETGFPDLQALLANALLETVNWNAPSDRSHLLPSELKRFQGRVHVALADCYAEVSKVYGMFRSNDLRREIDGLAEQVAVLMMTEENRPEVENGFVVGMTAIIDAAFGREVAVVAGIG